MKNQKWVAAHQQAGQPTPHDAPHDEATVEDKILAFCSVPRSRDELLEYLKLSDWKISEQSKKLMHAHKYFACGSLVCMGMAIYSGHKIAPKKKKAERHEQ